MTTNEVFQGFVDRYEHRPLPSDQVAADFLMDSFGLPAADAKTCFKVIIENLTDYGLIAHEGGTRVITPPGEIPSTASSSSNAGDAETDQSEPTTSAYDDVVPEPATEVSHSVLSTNGAAAVLGDGIHPQIAFNIQIQLPENASPETYEAIFKNISVHLLGRTEE